MPVDMGDIPQKKAFNFYRSYHDILKHLNDKQYVQLSRAINSVMFFEIHIDSVSFKDNMVSALWTSIKHSLQASIDGFTSKNKVDYNSLLTTPYQGAYQGGTQDPCQQGEEKGEGEGEGEYTLPAQKRFDVFYSAYPNKKSPKDAKKAWSKLKLVNGLFDAVMKGLENAKKSDDWKKNNGQFIPHPATWLNGRRWEDEYSTPQQSESIQPLRSL